MPANYVLLEKITIGAVGVASVTFNSIPQSGYTDLVLKMSARTARTNDGNGDDVKLYFNGDFGSNYSNRTILGTGSTASSENISATNLGVYGITASNSSAANTFGSGEYYIPNYTSSAQKTVSSETVSETFINTAYARLVAGSWTGTAAITSITLQPGTGPTFIQNSTFYLYGVAKLGVSPVIAPKATGGQIIETDGTYWYHAFLSSGTFTPSTALSCDVLTVGGGGAAGVNRAGGGGAGGLVYTAAQSFIAATPYYALVGAGGPQNSTSQSPGLKGSDTSVSGGTLSLTTAYGGGGGGSYNPPTLTTNGSGGGGGGSNNNTAGLATAGQGNNGGIGRNTGNFAGGGGGGAGAVGSAATDNTGGAGGAGVNTYSTWLSTTGLGVSGFIAGGGGGAGGTSAGAGGAGGGGAGGAPFTGGTSSGGAVSGTANTGGGAGGAADNVPTTAASGGSGLVIIRYTVA
jgi:hypothetical protein